MGKWAFANVPFSSHMEDGVKGRAPDKVRKINFNRLHLCYLFTKSQWDDSNKWSNIGFGEERGNIEIKIHHWPAESEN